jgi:urease accessory protein
MIELTKKITEAAQIDASLTLPLESRVKSRLRAILDDGREVGLFLERGQTLQGGQLLSNKDGIIVEIKAADEKVSKVTSDNPLLMRKACYHLGNRHVALQISMDSLCYLHDHVLDDMVRGLGLTVEVVEAPFEPEAGAYSASSGHHHHH